ncbi:MAG: class I SAM-dependent methyltransferase [Microthrixaceae bacterium]
MDHDREDLQRVYRNYAEDEKVGRRWSADNAGNRLIIDERLKGAEDRLSRLGLLNRDLCVLDLGCGAFTLVPESIESSLRIGVDILFDRLIAAKRSSPFDGVACADGADLPFGDELFDLIVISTVLSSIRSDAAQSGIGREVTRTLKPGGSVLWYDMRYPNPSNRNVHPVTKNDLVRLFPDLRQDLTPITVVPQLARRLGDRPGLYRAVARLGIANSHLLGTLTKPV